MFFIFFEFHYLSFVPLFILNLFILFNFLIIYKKKSKLLSELKFLKIFQKQILKEDT